MKWTIQPSVDFRTGDIRIETFDSTIGEVDHRIACELIHTKEKAIRAALIKLGWTPPKEEPNDPTRTP